MNQIDKIMKNREPGYYWVKRDDNWIIAEYETCDWYLFGIELIYNDDAFDEIDECRIEKMSVTFKQKYRIVWICDFMYINPPVVGYRIMPLNKEAKSYIMPNEYFEIYI